ncbi:MAG: DUF5069 domain-containing protein [Candidatus Eremiobacteraeota bacterium]|nr:DUF5069 domain-containing protein [Candidatus Eremiobacteraeota bacterium]MBC5827955.1 DUF5069 domain-containing protein [Candidatus Eremiobacteraeota bacterium]
MDLTKRPPARVYESLDGLMFLPRTIDKARAMLPGGKPGDYKMSGFSETMFSTIGVAEADFIKAVARAQGNEDVAAWLRDHADRSKYESYNQWLRDREINAENREHLEKRYPAAARDKQLTSMLDMLDADDRESFGS